MKKNRILYPLTIGLFAFLIWLVIEKGKHLEPGSVTATSSMPGPAGLPAVSLSLLLLQILTIFFVSKVFGWLAKKIGQPSVVGEIVAGVFLGPSLMGWVLPGISGFVFPKDSLGSLQFLSQIGLLFFMFLIGADLDIGKLKNKAQSAVVISHASIIFPYFLGVAIAYFLYNEFAPTHTRFLSFSLFMGIAMSITAFPVLARILQEKGLTKTSYGSMALTCAAADDVTAWCILAAVIAIVKSGSILTALIAISFTLVFVLAMVWVVRPWLKKTIGRMEAPGDRSGGNDKSNEKILTLVFLILFAAAWLAERIGIHALFGAFLAGTVMPKTSRFRELLAGKTEDISVVVLLPLYFAFTGLRTQIGLLNDTHAWVVCGVIVFFAITGKFGGSAVAARITGHSWKDALSIGALMNTRGLMELIVLNIGYDLGILSPQIFATLVIMALVTTFMTVPLLNLIGWLTKKEQVIA